MLTMGVAVQVAADWVGDAGKIVDYGVRFTKPVLVDAVEGATVVVTGKVGEIDAEAGEVRVDLTVIYNETAVLGKAQARVRL
jgi:acyl dehydratase